MNKLAIYEQLCQEIKRDIGLGILKAGDKLPSVRKYALEKNINPNTAVKVYKTLEVEGIINSIPSKGNFINDDAESLHALHVLTLKKECSALIKELQENQVQKSDILEIVEGVYDDFEG